METRPQQKSLWFEESSPDWQLFGNTQPPGVPQSCWCNWKWLARREAVAVKYHLPTLSLLPVLNTRLQQPPRSFPAQHTVWGPVSCSQQQQVPTSSYRTGVNHEGEVRGHALLLPVLHPKRFHYVRNN